MAPTKRDTSNSGLYDRLEDLRKEIKSDISTAVNTVAMSQGRLEKKFDDLEAGRLTRAEGNIQDLRITVQRLADGGQVLSGKFLALGAIGMIILSGLTSVLVALVIKGFK